MKPLSLIILEDNDGDFLLLEDYLLEKYHSLSTKRFVDFQSFLDYSEQSTIECDLIFLDLHLPDRSGTELIHHLITITKQIPILILTGYSDLPLAKKSLELGIFDFLIKDEINPSLIYKSIEFAISRSFYIREIEKKNDKLRDIAWTQSHLVRSPLSRMLGIINLIEMKKDSMEDLLFLLDNLRTSANELDALLKDTVEKTQNVST